MKTVEDKKKAKVKVKQDKNCKTSKIKSMKRLTLGNIQIRSFKNVLSDNLVDSSTISFNIQFLSDS